MHIPTTLRCAVFAVLALGTTATQAITIIDDMNGVPSPSVGYSNSYPWTSVVFSHTGWSSSNGVLSMVTHPYQGIWFGNGAMIGQYPGWNLGSSSDGNYLSMTLQLSPGAADWGMYFYDRNGYGAYLNFNPSGCLDYSCAGQNGFEYWYQNTSTNQAVGSFVSWDLAATMSTFEVLLKNGQVSYALNGQLLFSGAAYQSTTANLLVIGDGSGSTGTGTGAMYLDQVIFDNAPDVDVLTTTAVPVPAALPLLLSGLGLFGIAAKRRRSR